MKQAIIVGFGLAGFHYAFELQKHKKDFIIISNEEEGSSRSAAGVFNPTVLKKYTMSWKGKAFFDQAIITYKLFEKTYNTSIFNKVPIKYYFNRLSDHNNWAVASQKKGLNHFLSRSIINKVDGGLKGDFGYGKLKNVGKLDINKLLDKFKNKLASDCFSQSTFNYKELKILDNKIEYKGIMAKYIIFCEGFKLRYNPWFSYLPLIGSKGEFLYIRTKAISQKAIIKRGLFIVPIGKDLFWIGANFDRKYKTLKPTKLGKEWILSKLKDITDCSYEVINHKAAIRPTVKDRRPLLGAHPIEKNIYVFNGMGTRGVLMGPLLAKWMYNFIVGGKKLCPEIAIDRFDTYFSNPRK